MWGQRRSRPHAAARCQPTWAACSRMDWQQALATLAQRGARRPRVGPAQGRAAPGAAAVQEAAGGGSGQQVGPALIAGHTRGHPPPSRLALACPPLSLQMAKDKRQEVCTREYTINLGKRLHDITFKKRAPRAVKEIKKFAQKQMGTKEVRVDVKLNKAVWSQVGPRRAAGAGAWRAVQGRDVSWHCVSSCPVIKQQAGSRKGSAAMRQQCYH